MYVAATSLSVSPTSTDTPTRLSTSKAAAAATEILTGVILQRLAQPRIHSHKGRITAKRPRKMGCLPTLDLRRTNESRITSCQTVESKVSFSQKQTHGSPTRSANMKIRGKGKFQIRATTTTRLRLRVLHSGSGTTYIFTTNRTLVKLALAIIDPFRPTTLVKHVTTAE